LPCDRAAGLRTNALFSKIHIDRAVKVKVLHGPPSDEARSFKGRGRKERKKNDVPTDLPYFEVLSDLLGFVIPILWCFGAPRAEKRPKSD
jgi:hypothetical protein